MPNKTDAQQYEIVGDRVRIFERSGRWYANFQYDGRQVRQSLKTSSKKQARQQALLIEAKLMTNEFAVQKRAPSLEAVIDAYRNFLQTEGRAAKTMAKYQNAFKLFKELASRRKVRSILGVNQAFVDAFRKERKVKKDKATAAMKTIHTDTVILRQVVNFAIHRGMIANDPLRGLKIARPKSPPQPFWTKAEMDKIIAAAGKTQRAVFTLLAETGMRIGELKHLTWGAVDLENGVIHVQAKDGWKPKSGDARVIPISPASRAVLTKRPQTGRWVFTAGPSKKFPAGGQVSERRLLEHLKRVLKGLNLRGHLHTFRHSFISHALTRGIPEALVRKWVGHVDAEILKRYTHIADGESKAAMERLAAAGVPSVTTDKEARS